MLPLTKKKAKIPITIFILVFTIFISNLPADYSRDLKNLRYRRMMVSADIIPNTFLPWLISYKKTVSFDSILETMQMLDGGAETPYFLIETSKGYKTAYPFFPSLLAVPFYLIPALMSKIPEVTYHENILKVFLLGRVTAAFYASVAVVLFYYLLKQISKNEKWIIIFTLFYAFGTSTWSIASRGMWQHTFSQLFFTIVLLLLLKGRTNKRLIPWVGFVSGLLVLIRPTNLILAIVVSLYVFFQHKKQILSYIMLVLPSILFLGGYNLLTYGNPFIEGYAARGYGVLDLQHWSTPIGEGLLGFFVSPGRSFLFLSPPLFLSFFAFFMTFKSKKFGGSNNKLYRYLVVGTLLTMFLMAKWVTWHGANAFGYRMLSDALPIFGLFAFEVLRKLSEKKKLVILGFIIYAVVIHFNATIFRKSRCSLEDNWSFYCLKLPKEKSKY